MEPKHYFRVVACMLFTCTVLSTLWTYPHLLAYFNEAAGMGYARPPSGLNSQADRTEDQQDTGPLPGWYAISVNHIWARSPEYHYFQRFQPVAMAGYSIYIYHITLDEANRVRRDLGLPELETERGWRKGKDREMLNAD